MRIGIVEDSLENVETLKILLDQSGLDLSISGVATDLHEAGILLQKPLDLALLDIQLKEGTIFEVLQNLTANNHVLPEIVFVTAHGSLEYATKAIQFACLDFLTKPLDLEELRETLIKAQEKQQQSNQQQVGFLLDLLKGNMQSPKSIGVILPRGVIEFVELADITHILADENTCILHLQDQSIMHSTRHMGYYVDLLLGNAEFVQINKSCTVNATHIKRYDHRQKTLNLKNGTTLIASHRYSKTLKKKLLDMEPDSFSAAFRRLFKS